jgi:GH24 family phage-related lysozyme (muramidase)
MFYNLFAQSSPKQTKLFNTDKDGSEISAYGFLDPLAEEREEQDAARSSLFDNNSVINNIVAPVGDGRENREEDVAMTRDRLGILNYRSDHDVSKNIFTKGLDSAIRLFQRDEGLKEDGLLRPDGPTEQRLKKRIKQSKPHEDHPLASTIMDDYYDDEVRGLIEKFEGKKHKIYLDHKGNPTVGIGFMIPNIKDALTYPFYNLDENKKPVSRASAIQIEKDFNKVKQGPIRKISDYDTLTHVGLIDSDINKLLNRKLRSSVDELKGKFKNFDDAPKDVKLGLLDMQFNIGDPRFQREFIDPSTGEKKGWGQLFNAYEAGDWKKMAKESHRIEPSKERNDAIFNLFYNAK